MVKQSKTEVQDTKLLFIKLSRGLSYFVYGFALTATSFLTLTFFLLLFSANAATPFVRFIYETAAAFLTPFRDIFPVRSISETGYFSPSILFAIIMYLALALAMNALISYITVKRIQHEETLATIEEK
jgi:uncharacterized protein YggT (Ycf19 family)